MNILSEKNYSAVWDSLDKISPAAGFVVTLIHLGKILSENGDKYTFADQGLSTEEFEALFIVSCNKEECRPTEISKYSVMQPAKITRVLDKLEKKGLLVREAMKKDRRATSLRLSSRGETLLNEATKALATSTEPLQKQLGEKGIKEISSALRIILNHMGK